MGRVSRDEVGEIDLLTEIQSYLAAYDLLRRDLKEVLEFVEPVDANKEVYSHRTYALLLRACTEFESIARDLLVDQGCEKPPKEMGVYDYCSLETVLQLEPVDVLYFSWHPQPLRLTPFRGCAKRHPPLSWYDSYNKVKHNRAGEFSHASLGVTVEALAGLFLVLMKVAGPDWDGAMSSQEGSKYEFYLDPFCASGPLDA